MYQQRNPQNTTSIDELPDIEELEGPRPHQSAIRNHLKESKYPGAEMLPVGEADKFEKYIRQGHNPSIESGMSNIQGPPMNPNVSEMYQDEESFTEYLPPSYPSPSPQNQHIFKRNLKTIDMPANSPSCIEVAEHFLNCPVCSRLYNNDKTAYIIAIVVLAFISILLLKKVLDV